MLNSLSKDFHLSPFQHVYNHNSRLKVAVNMEDPNSPMKKKKKKKKKNGRTSKTTTN